MPYSADEAAVLLHDRAVPEDLRQGEGLDRGVAVQLHVLALAAQQTQQAVRQLVLPHALVADQQQVPAQSPVQEHVSECGHVLWHVDKVDIWHKLQALRLAHWARDVLDPELPV